ncbi:hypothetical protein M413DRAFT_24540 [Hebeloma cylindrosporum]|uniref:Uncharacterized protein n=1 Tax=Hebeloma cylindrosporum TaxID=76867 RepID=A0A0C3CNC4_HEBCY|nr:hypothetical protein M413DRAFT_24540 [Hebeloma cylindrosporum h7]
MSHSTTGTSSYILTKYSRSYPVKRTLQKAQISSQIGPETAQEWQHFINPTIRLVLDVKASSIGELESVRLRILWQLDAGSNQPDISFASLLFEDLDLLSFASIASNVPRTQHIEALPLKAVYRDTVVGIRYFHNREDDDVPVYRRFQISFQSSSEAADLIEMIKPVCICKLNPITPGQSGPAPQTQIRRPTIRPQQPSVAASKSLLPNRGSPYTYPSFSNSKPTPPVRKEFVQGSQHIHQPSSSVTPFALSSSPNHLPISDTLFNSSSPPQPSAGRLLTVSSKPSINIKDLPIQNSEQWPSRIHEYSVPIMDNRLAIANNLPSSSIPSLPSSISSANILEPRAVSNSEMVPVNHEETRRGFLASMGETTSIYALSNTALEQMIGEVIREDGFVQLLEKISEMWTIKNVAGI